MTGEDGVVKREGPAEFAMDVKSVRKWTCKKKVLAEEMI